jgi:hypothetical protein
LAISHETSPPICIDKEKGTAAEHTDGAEHNKRGEERRHLVGSLHLRGLGPLAEVGGEAEAPLVVLDDADDVAPSPERLLRRVLGLNAPKVVVQVALHLESIPTNPAGGVDRYISRLDDAFNRVGGR